MKERRFRGGKKHFAKEGIHSVFVLALKRMHFHSKRKMNANASWLRSLTVRRWRRSICVFCFVHEVRVGLKTVGVGGKGCGGLKRSNIIWKPKARFIQFFLSLSYLQILWETIWLVKLVTVWYWTSLLGVKLLNKDL